MDDNYDYEFFTYLTSSTNETTNNNNNVKRVNLSDKPSFAQSFFEFYDQLRIKPENKLVTKAKCKVKDCQTQYVYLVEELKKSSQQTIETTLLKPYLASRQQKLT
ncbi:14390_t:CDS:2 [Racocetra persica]|uniref:14390_t:CDS:1 n=1 Tax=Racocetra persica TaxID=160502 RepID=A0ACA9KEQ1_9GLOM|nr:14390_t:CDS:2 [Racocetra persica]